MTTCHGHVHELARLTWRPNRPATLHAVLDSLAFKSKLTTLAKSVAAPLSDSRHGSSWQPYYLKGCQSRWADEISSSRVSATRSDRTTAPSLPRWRRSLPTQHIGRQRHPTANTACHQTSFNGCSARSLFTPEQRRDCAATQLAAGTDTTASTSRLCWSRLLPARRLQTSCLHPPWRAQTTPPVPGHNRHHHPLRTTPPPPPHLLPQQYQA